VPDTLKDAVSINNTWSSVAS
jgi:hypothetical protein